MPTALRNANSAARGVKKIVLQPHQKALCAHVAEMRFPFYIYWGMGSGKTFGGLLCATGLGDGARVLIVCDKSVKEQWEAETAKLLARNCAEFPNLKVHVEHYEHLDDAKGSVPRHFALVVVDEAHRFRNAWSRQSTRMLSWMHRIRECPRVVFMSGTPVVHDAETETHALLQMMGEETPLHGRVSHYDPREDLKRGHYYASVADEEVCCPMTWAQCFLYLQHRRQKFSLRLEGETEDRTRLSSSRNSYNTLLRSVSNSPFPEDPALSPKMVLIAASLCEHEAEKRQLVFSSRRDTGVDGLMQLYRKQTKFPKAIYRVDGSMSINDRADQVRRYNRCSRGVLFLTEAGGQGIDCKRVSVVHVMEPSDNLQEERQVINRAVRFKAHRERNAVVAVFRYISTFPTSGSVVYPWKKTLDASGLFARDELSGITRKVQYALLRLIRDEEHGETIDQRTLRTRLVRDAQVQIALQWFRTQSIEAASSKPPAHPAVAEQPVLPDEEPEALETEE